MGEGFHLGSGRFRAAGDGLAQPDCDYAVYFILRVQKKDNRTTLQAKPNAPVLVNIRNRQARQVIVSLSPSLEKAEALCLSL